MPPSGYSLPVPSRQRATCPCASAPQSARHQPQKPARQRPQVSAKQPSKSTKAARQLGRGQRRVSISSTTSIRTTAPARSSRSAIAWIRRNSANIFSRSASSASGSTAFTRAALRSSTSDENTPSCAPAPSCDATWWMSNTWVHAAVGQQRWPSTLTCRRVASADRAASTIACMQSQQRKWSAGQTQPSTRRWWSRQMVHWRWRRRVRTASGTAAPGTQ
mmetsp:Transcript_41570/g.74718  ORF Transcript_41570/g.74718 Transcript_41570/m.74718 type:complete len:219 (-) Transcript_41570:4620-5276(-)